MTDKKITEQVILDDIKNIVAREVKDLKRKKDNLTSSEIAALEKYTKIVATLMSTTKDIEQDLRGMSTEDLEALAE